MPQERTEFGYVAQRSRVGCQHLQQIALVDIAYFIVQEHYWLRTEQAGSVENVVGSMSQVNYSAGQYAVGVIAGHQVPLLAVAIVQQSKITTGELFA